MIRSKSFEMLRYGVPVKLAVVSKRRPVFGFIQNSSSVEIIAHSSSFRTDARNFLNCPDRNYCTHLNLSNSVWRKQSNVVILKLYSQLPSHGETLNTFLISLLC